MMRQQQQRERDLAVIEHQMATAPERSSVALWLERIACLKRLDRSDALLAVYDAALEQWPDEPKLWRYRGLQLAYQQQFEAALASYQQATVHSPQMTVTDLHYQADALLELERYENALEFYDQILQLLPH